MVFSAFFEDCFLVCCAFIVHLPFWSISKGFTPLQTLKSCFGSTSVEGLVSSGPQLLRALPPAQEETGRVPSAVLFGCAASAARVDCSSGRRTESSLRRSKSTHKAG